jgi:predicted GIY-YIG superfamily endonuclease
MTDIDMTASVSSTPTEQRARTAVYRLYDADGTPLYIGLTNDPERRFKQHRSSKPWWPQVARKVIDWYPTRDRAFLEEADAIETETPIHNTNHNPVASRILMSSHWPPFGIPADRAAVIERSVETLPPDEAQRYLRNVALVFTRNQHAAAMLSAARSNRTRSEKAGVTA